MFKTNKDQEAERDLDVKNIILLTYKKIKDLIMPQLYGEKVVLETQVWVLAVKREITEVSKKVIGNILEHDLLSVLKIEDIDVLKRRTIINI